MSILVERVFPEIADTIASTVGLDSSNIISKSTKFIREDWLTLLQYFQSLSSLGLEPPYVILRPMPLIPEDYGMANVYSTLPIEIFFINSERNRIGTTCTGNDSTAVKTVASTTNMFAGQRLFFKTANDFRLVVSVDSATQVTLSSTITTVNEENIVSDLSSDIECRVDQLRYAFRRGERFTNYQIMQDPESDVTDMNPLNEALSSENYQVFGGSCTIYALIGESP